MIYLFNSFKLGEHLAADVAIYEIGIAFFGASRCLTFNSYDVVLAGRKEFGAIVNFGNIIVGKCNRFFVKAEAIREYCVLVIFLKKFLQLCIVANYTMIGRGKHTVGNFISEQDGDAFFVKLEIRSVYNYLFTVYGVISAGNGKF